MQLEQWCAHYPSPESSLGLNLSRSRQLDFSPAPKRGDPAPGRSCGKHQRLNILTSPISTFSHRVNTGTHGEGQQTSSVKWLVSAISSRATEKQRPASRNTGSNGEQDRKGVQSSSGIGSEIRGKAMQVLFSTQCANAEVEARKGGSAAPATSRMNIASG